MWILVGVLAHVLGSEDPLARHDNDGNETSVRAPTQTSGWVVGPSGSMLQTESTNAENKTTNAAMGCWPSCSFENAIKALRTKALEVCAEKPAAANPMAGDDCCEQGDLPASDARGNCALVDGYIKQFFVDGKKEPKNWTFPEKSGGFMGFGKTTTVTSDTSLMSTSLFKSEDYTDASNPPKDLHDLVYARKDACSNAFGELKNAFVGLKSVKEQAKEVEDTATADKLKTKTGMDAFKSALDNFKGAWENEALGQRKEEVWTFKWYKKYQADDRATHRCFAGMDAALQKEAKVTTRKLYDAFETEWKFIATELNAARTAVKALVDNIKATADGSGTIDLHTALTVKKEHKKVLDATVEALEKEVTRADPDKQPPGEGYAFIAKVNKCGKALANQLQTFLDAANNGMPASGEMSVVTNGNVPTGYYVKVSITESDQETQKQGLPFIATVLEPGLEGKLANDMVPTEKKTYREKYSVGSRWNVAESHLRNLVDNKKPPEAVANHWKVHQIFESAKKCDEDANQELKALKNDLEGQLDKVKTDAGLAETDATTCQTAVDAIFEAHLKENTGFKSLKEIPTTIFA